MNFKTTIEGCIKRGDRWDLTGMVDFHFTPELQEYGNLSYGEMMELIENRTDLSTEEKLEIKAMIHSHFLQGSYRIVWACSFYEDGTITNLDSTIEEYKRGKVYSIKELINKEIEEAIEKNKIRIALEKFNKGWGLVDNRLDYLEWKRDYEDKVDFETYKTEKSYRKLENYKKGVK